MFDTAATPTPEPAAEPTLETPVAEAQAAESEDISLDELVG